MCVCVCVCVVGERDRRKVGGRKWTLPAFLLLLTAWLVTALQPAVKAMASQTEPGPPPSGSPGDAQERFSKMHKACWPSIQTVHKCQLEKIYNQQRAW